MAENGFVIETRDLTKRYGEAILAVDRLKLRVRRGEVYGFLGPNGAGKTTTLRMLLGLVRPTHGSAVVLDATPGAPGGLGRIGAMIESAALYPFLSGRDNLRVLARHARVPERIGPALEEVGLGKRGGWSRQARRRSLRHLAMSGSISAELLVQRKRASTWILLGVFTALSVFFLYVLPYTDEVTPELGTP